MEQIEELDIVRAHELINHIRAENNEKRLREEWTAVYPFMLAGVLKYMNFKEYKDAATGGNIDTRPAEDIMADVEEVRRYIG